MKVPQGQYYGAVYVNLSPEDIDALTAEAWDTLRVLVLDDTQELAIASGYGSTHSSMVEQLRLWKQTRRLWTTDSIVYFEGKQALVTDSGTDQGNSLPPSKWHKIYSQEHEDTIRLLCSERGLCL